MFLNIRFRYKFYFLNIYIIFLYFFLCFVRKNQMALDLTIGLANKFSHYNFDQQSENISFRTFRILDSHYIEIILN